MDTQIMILAILIALPITIILVKLIKKIITIPLILLLIKPVIYIVTTYILYNGIGK